MRRRNDIVGAVWLTKAPAIPLLRGGADERALGGVCLPSKVHRKSFSALDNHSYTALYPLSSAVLSLPKWEEAIRYNWNQGLKKRTIIPYNPKLKELAKTLRNNSTPSEIHLWKLLKGKQLHGYDFHRQKPLDEYIVDFFCQELMLAIELDGRSHSLEEVQKKDHQKEKALNKLGIHVLRFSDGQVFDDLNNVIRSIEAYIENTEHTPATSTGPLTPSREGKPQNRSCWYEETYQIKQAKPA